MKLTQPMPRVAAASKATPDSDAKVWHPNMVQFKQGVEVTEVVDTLPGELLELFKPAPPAGSV